MGCQNKLSKRYPKATKAILPKSFCHLGSRSCVFFPPLLGCVPDCCHKERLCFRQISYDSRQEHDICYWRYIDLSFRLRVSTTDNTCGSQLSHDTAMFNRPVQHRLMSQKPKRLLIVKAFLDLLTGVRSDDPSIREIPGCLSGYKPQVSTMKYNSDAQLRR